MIGRSICRYLLQQVLVPLPCRSACAVLGIAVGYQECLAVCCPLLAVTFLSAQRTKICERFALLFFFISTAFQATCSTTFQSVYFFGNRDSSINHGRY